MLKIYLDTNMLMVPGQFRVDIFSEIDRLFAQNYELFTLGGVVEELESIAKTAKKGADKKAAKLGLQLIEKYKVKIEKIEGYVDTILAELSHDPDVIIATNDVELKRRLEGQVIYLRQKRYLEISRC